MSTRTRRRFDDDDFEPTTRWAIPSAPTIEQDDDSDDVAHSTYPDAMHGPSPLPDWVISSAAAIDTDLGVFKTGKEADVSLVRRTHAGRSILLAAKQYRDACHRMFHRDAGYLEGRRMRKSRENRAVATRTEFGRELIAGQWAFAEFSVLSRLWSAGAAVPYPVQLIGTELMMEFIGDADGVAAPRLVQTRPTRAQAMDWFDQLRRALVNLADAGYAHGDLSAYNVLVDDGRVVLIDLPQAVDLVANPQGFSYLRRDCDNICNWFQARGIDVDGSALFDDLVLSVPGT
ncbi:MAG TPA: RIO1 family regulatory kinase/ATPase [Ilumatobacteraceae bacterium]|nr:RIO1 family regulatory kinase/ATPase [Ilumatobacteraceae bacterium]